MITKSRYQLFLNSYYDEKMLFLFSVNSDFIFGKNAPCQLLWVNFKNKSDFFNYSFSFKLSAITRFCFSRLAFGELDQENKVTSSTIEFNISLCPSTNYADRLAAQDFVFLQVSLLFCIPSYLGSHIV